MGKNKDKKRVHIPGANKPPFPQDSKVSEAPHPHEIKVTKENVSEVMEGALEALEDGGIKDAEIISETIEAPISSSQENGSGWGSFNAWRVAMGYLPPDFTGENTQDQSIRDPKTGRMLPGFSLNPSGRPQGAVGFKTMFEKAVKRLAELNKLDPDMIEIDLVVKAIAQARGGDYRYYKDMADRLYGKPTDKVAIDHTTGGMPIQGGNQITFVDFSGKQDAPKNQ